MNLVNSKGELKVGDKLVFVDNIDNHIFINYCKVNNITYVIVVCIPEDETFILVNFINYKGISKIKNHPIKPFYKRKPRFAYYEGS